MSNKYCE